MQTFDTFKDIDYKNELDESYQLSKNSIDNLLFQISDSYLPYCTKGHVNKFIWKFNSNIKNTKYDWQDLYLISIKRERLAKFIIKYFSMYTHGLAIQTIKNETLDVVKNVHSFTNTIIDNLILILTEKYYS